MATIAKDIVIDAIDESGALGVGQSPLPEDLNKIFTRFQRMIKAWNQNRWLVPSLQDISFLADGSKSYSIGIGGDIDIQRPNQIKAAYVIQRNTGQTPVSFPLRIIPSYEDYALLAIKDLQSLPDHYFYDGAFPLANFFPYPIPNSLYELHIVIQNLLGFGSTIATGHIVTGGLLYTNGIYQDVELIGGAGSGATCDITVTAGSVALLNLDTGGKDFAIGNILSTPAAQIGGTGTGFTYIVDTITSTIDSEIIMPDEYEEALMYNLALRACSFYQVDPIDETKRIAKASLNTIRKNNTQIPTLQMPNAPGLRRGKAFSLYNPDGYGYG